MSAPDKPTEQQRAALVTSLRLIAAEMFSFGNDRFAAAAKQERELDACIRSRHERSGDLTGLPEDYERTVPPLRAVDVPPWLTAGARIKCESKRSVSTLLVLVVRPEMCLVVGDGFVHAVETEKLVKYWEVA